MFKTLLGEDGKAEGRYEETGRCVGLKVHDVKSTKNQQKVKTWTILNKSCGIQEQREPTFL